MRKKTGILRSFIFISLLMLGSAPYSHAASELTVEVRSDVGLFYEQLAPYGIWTKLKSGQLVWVPTQTPTDWRPYTMGEWFYTNDQGWYWNSAWPWGWATFHYGRWLFDDDYGWSWVPGGQWAPSWVAWRIGNEAIGWAPLSPDVSLNGGTQELDDQALNRDIDIYAWSFAPVRELFSKSLHAKSISMSARNVTMAKSTRSSTHYEIQGDKVINHGVSPEYLKDNHNLDVKRLEMVDVTFPGGIEATHLTPGHVAVFRPIISLKTDVNPPSAESALANMGKGALEKSHNSLKSSLDMYHMLEIKALSRIHEQQAAEVDGQNSLLEEQQKIESQSLKRLHAREQSVLKKRINRELKAIGGS